MNSIWQIGIIALVAGALIGALAYRLFAPSMKQAAKDRAELDSARRELTDYKVSVNQHFNKTSELVNDLTQNYVKVYQHLAEGAHALGDSKTFNNLLEQHPGKVSLTVDGESHLPDPVVTDTIVETAAPVDAPAEPASDLADTVTDEHEAVAAPSEAADDKVETAAAASPEEPDSPAEAAPEPALDAEALDETAGKEATETTADAGGVMPENGDESKTSRTVH